MYLQIFLNIIILICVFLEKLAKVAAGTISLFVISWAGYVVFAIAGINGRDDLVTPYTTQIPVMLAKTSATWNPFLYALTHPKFR